MTVVDECRRYLDKVLKFLDMWPEMGTIGLPAETIGVSQLLRELWTGRSATPDVKKPEQKAAPEATSRKRGKIPVPRRAKSASGFTSPCDRPTEKSNGRLVSPRPRARAEAAPPRTVTAGIAQQQSPRIPPISPITSESPDVLAAPLDDMPILSELRDFEGRFTTYIAAVGTNDLIARMLNELRVTQRTIQQGSWANQHFERLNDQLTQMSQKMTNGRPAKELQNLCIALENFRKVLEEPASPARLERAVDALSQQLDSAPELRSRVDDQLLAAGAGNSAGRRKVISEMQVVSARLAAVQQERSRADPQDVDDVDDIDAEIEALLKQQGDLVEKLGLGAEV
jgi:hypothetical protein